MASSSAAAAAAATPDVMAESFTRATARAEQVAERCKAQMPTMNAAIDGAFGAFGAVRMPLYRMIGHTELMCSECGLLEHTSRCTQCGVGYCSPTCQRVAWIEHNHRKVCMTTPRNWAKWIDANLSNLMWFANAQRSISSLKTSDEWDAKLTEMLDATTAVTSVKLSLSVARVKWTQATAEVRAICSTSRSINSTFIPLLAYDAFVDGTPNGWNTLCMAIFHQPMEHHLTREVVAAMNAASTVCCVFSEPCFNLAASPPKWSLPSLRIPTATLLREFDQTSAPTVYTVALDYPPDGDGGGGCETSLPPGSRGNSIEVCMAVLERSLAAKLFSHEFTIVCMKTEAFIVQNCYGYYTHSEWLAFDRPLVMCAAMPMSSSTIRFPLHPSPPVRGVAPRGNMLTTVGVIIDLLTGSETDPSVRASAYTSLTGLHVDPLAHRFTATVNRVNLSALRSSLVVPK